MALQCPRCNSIHVESLDRAKKAGGAIGFAGGAATGAASAFSGARVGAAVGMAAGPVGASLGGIIGAVLGGLMGGTAGGLAGAKLGRLIDDRLLQNHHCLNCDHVFATDSAKSLDIKPPKLKA